jgi:hypothetical protein
VDGVCVVQGVIVVITGDGCCLRWLEVCRVRVNKVVHHSKVTVNVDQG